MSRPYLTYSVALLFAAFGAFSCAKTTAKDLVPISKDQLYVTSGSIKETDSGTLFTEEPVVRAVATTGHATTASLEFRYLGPTENKAAFASGQVVSQIGLKLRSMNTCNLLYVMWRIEPKEHWIVLLKRNPGQSTHEQCGAQGYQQIAYLSREKSSWGRPTATDRKVHHLTAEVLEVEGRGYQYFVRVDGEEILSGEMRRELLEDITGPVGFRSDNGVFEFKLYNAS